MNAMCRAIVVSTLMILMAGCSTAQRSESRPTGRVTGVVAACTAYAFDHPASVSVYAGKHMVATQRLTHADIGFRFSLPVGRYSVRDENGSHAVSVAKGATAHIPEFMCL